MSLNAQMSLKTQICRTMSGISVSLHDGALHEAHARDCTVALHISMDSCKGGAIHSSSHLTFITGKVGGGLCIQMSLKTQICRTMSGISVSLRDGALHEAHARDCTVALHISMDSCKGGAIHSSSHLTFITGKVGGGRAC